MATDIYDKVERDLNFLMSAFRDVLVDLGETAVAQALPWHDGFDGAEASGAGPLSAEAPWPDDTVERRTHAFSIALQLLTQAEENAVAQHRRIMEAEGRLGEEGGSWDEVLARLRGRGMDAGAIAEALPRTFVEPVFTAHPTEAKRASVLAHHRALYRLLVESENQMWTPHERDAIRDDVKACLERLYRTVEIIMEKPQVTAELANVAHFTRHVFPDVLPWVERRLRSAWSTAGFEPALLADPARRARLSFGTWVGGDRDGHPLVTAAVTRQTLATLRSEALSLLRERLSATAARLSLSEHRQAPPDALTHRIAAMADALGDAGAAAVARNPREPWRQHINLMLAALPDPDTQAPRPGIYTEADELVDDLDLLHASLIAVGAERIARIDVEPVRAVAATFGFHLATLDIRQNSAFHDRAISQLLAAAGCDGGGDYDAWDEDARRRLLERELASPRPFVHPDAPLGDEASAVLACYRVVADEIARHGGRSIGALIVSMTRDLSDLLVVYLLAREAGLLRFEGGECFCVLPVVPLFETIDDLERAPDILERFLAHPVTRASVARQCRQERLDRPIQQVMVGYSDSNKDGGIVASLWGLHRAQAAMVRVGARHDVLIRFFHGRGGTISRGAGPTHQFIRSLPRGALDGGIRLTEQGETIAQKYANRVTATVNLERLLAETLGASAGHHANPRAAGGNGAGDRHSLSRVMDRLANDSGRVYRALTTSNGFIPFFGQATPIDAIEMSRIGSRPARRTGQRTLKDLRAIPWVFSWNQARFSLSGWYGLGSALAALKANDPPAYERLVACKRARAWGPLEYLIGNIATTMATADVDIMRAYAELVEDEDVRDTFMSAIEREFALVRAGIEDMYGQPLAKTRPRVDRLLHLRRVALRPLHAQQIDPMRAVDRALGTIAALINVEEQRQWRPRQRGKPRARRSTRRSN